MKKLTKNTILASAFVSATFAASIANAQEDLTPSRSVETFKAWSVECTKIEVAAKKGEAKTKEKKFKRVCEAIQSYHNKKTGNEIARLAFAIDSKDKTKVVAALRTLVDVSFEKTPGIFADGKEIVKGKFRRCTGNFCYAFFDVSDKNVKALERSKTGKAQYPISNGAMLRIKISTQGYTAALAALRSRAAEQK